MKICRRITAFFLVLTAVLCLAACRSQKVPPVSDPESETAEGISAVQETDTGIPDDPYAEKRAEIESAMLLACQTNPRVVEYPDMSPTSKKYSNIRAITFDGLDRAGMKTKTFAYYSVPVTATEESPVPAVVLVPGGGCHPMDLEWVRVWISRGYAVIYIDSTGSFPTVRDIDLYEGEEEPYVYGPCGLFEEEGYTAAPCGGMGSCDGEVEDMWLTYAVSDTILAANVLRADPRVIPDQVGITGVSWGSVICSVSIAYDNRFAFAIPVYGSGFLGEQLAALRDSFRYEGFRQLWAAEDRYADVTIPILWLCSNNDNCFSINSNSDSFLATMNNNPMTRLCIRDGFGHSHSLAWNIPDNYTFAASVVKGGQMIAGFLNQPDGRDIRVELDVSGRASVHPTLYYLTEPMSYGQVDPNCFLDQEWHTAPLEYDEETHRITGTVPEEAAGYYIEVKEGKEVSTSAYIVLS